MKTLMEMAQANDLKGIAKSVQHPDQMSHQIYMVERGIADTRKTVPGASRMLPDKATVIPIQSRAKSRKGVTTNASGKYAARVPMHDSGIKGDDPSGTKGLAVFLRVMTDIFHQFGHHASKDFGHGLAYKAAINCVLEQDTQRSRKLNKKVEQLLTLVYQQTGPWPGICEEKLSKETKPTSASYICAGYGYVDRDEFCAGQTVKADLGKPNAVRFDVYMNTRGGCVGCKEAGRPTELWNKKEDVPTSVQTWREKKEAEAEAA